MKYQFLDLEVIIKKTLIFAGLFGMVMAVVGLVSTLTQEIIGRYLNVGQMVSTAISVLIAIVLYDPTRKLLVNLTDRFLFQKREEIKVVLNRLSERIITILDLDKVAETILSTLRDSLRLEAGALVVKGEDEESFKILQSFGLDGPAPDLLRNHALIGFLAQNKRPLNLETPEALNRLPAAIATTLQSFKARQCLPLVLSEELIGLLILGKKKSDQEFTKEELEFFPTVASQAAVALSNARVIEIQRRSQVDYAQQAKLASLGTLVAGISHEVKNPLAMIRAGLEMLRFNKKQGVYQELSKEQYESVVDDVIERLLKQEGRATSVIDRLSTFAKKRKDLKIEWVSLQETIEEPLNFLAPSLEKQGITVERKYAPDLPPFLADFNAISDCFLNLLANANHAIQGEGTITVTTARKEDELEATVGDTGVGIPQADLEKIFDPFYTTKETGRTDDPKVIKGTGLGLFLVRETIRRYRGRITVESAVGRGTSFHVFFPIAAGELKND